MSTPDEPDAEPEPDADEQAGPCARLYQSLYADLSAPPGEPPR